MKLRNKLIPFAGCLALGASIAPISLTSCGFYTAVELKDGYTPAVAKYTNETSKLTEAQAEEVYFKAAKENPDIVAQDYNWMTSILLKTAADNPGQLLGDSKTSKIETATQEVKNISFGKTKITYESTSGSKTVELNTISFDFVREQRFTYSYDEAVGSSKIENQITGNTSYKMSFKNIPVNFYGGFTTNNANSNESALNYDPHLGRGLYYYPNVIKYVPSEWFLMTAILPDASTAATAFNKYALYNMKDSWEISYEFETFDIKYATFQGITTEQTETSALNGSYNDFKSIDPTDAAAQEILGFRIGSYYLSDMHALN